MRTALIPLALILTSALLNPSAYATSPTAAPLANAASKTLAQSKNCMACHALDKKVVGPAFRGVAERYKGDSKAQEKLSAKVRAGGAGSWGQIPMPANLQVSETEAHQLVGWILAGAPD